MDPVRKGLSFVVPTTEEENLFYDRVEVRMAEEYPASAKVYPTADFGKFSILDMLAYFEEHGAMRVSDLHLKVAAPPTYRIDGELVKMKGPDVTPEMAKHLIYPLLNEENIHKLTREHNVDCSYRRGSVQYRINVFRENDGIAAAIRALSLDIPKVETIGFPNDGASDSRTFLLITVLNTCPSKYLLASSAT